MASMGGWHSGTLFECFATTGSPTFVTSSPAPRDTHLARSLRLVNGDEAAVARTNTSGWGTSMAITAYLQFSSLPSSGTTGRPLIEWWDTAGAVSGYLGIDGTGYMRLYDANGTEQASGLHGMSTGTWYRVTFTCFSGTTTGSLSVSVDGTSIASATSIDTVASIQEPEAFNFLGNTDFGNLSIADWSQSSVTEPFQIIKYDWDSGSTKTGTEDAGSFGNAATIPWQTTVDFELTASTNWVGWLTDAATGGGPSGTGDLTDASSYSTCAIYLLKRDGGGSTSHYIYSGFTSTAPTAGGRNVGTASTSNYTVQTSPSMIDTAVGSTWNTGEDCGLAVGVSGAQDIHCYGAIAQVLYFPPVDTSRTVTCTTEVVSAVANAATINKQRGVNAGTEVVQASTNDATVLVGVTINGVTEAVSVTTSPAAVARDRLVAAVSEAVIAQTVNAIVNSTRNVDGATETVLVTENNADVARDRTITGLTEVVQAVANSASVVRPRAVAAVTEVIVLTEVDASVSRGISISGTVEEIVVTETSASVGKSRNVLGASEVVAVPVNGAGINRSRIVVGTTEVLQAIEAAASVNTTRNVDGATEIVTVTENNANVNLSRPVSGAVEVITVTENNATITYSGTPLIVSGLTEAVTVSSVAAAINATRNVQASTEAVNATTNAAVVNTSRGVAGFVEALNVAMNSADINKARGVLGNTEVVVLEEYPATVELGPPPVVSQGRGISSDVGRHITIDITTDIT